MLFKHINEERPVQNDNRHNIPFHDEVDIQLGLSITPHSIQRKGMMGLGKDLSGKLTFGESQLSGYENPKKSQPELSPNIVFPPSGVPDWTLGSNHCTLDHTFNKSVCTWAPQLPFSRLRTYTKVCFVILLICTLIFSPLKFHSFCITYLLVLVKVMKRGAVGRSIDITRYSGYQELKQDVARIFGIEGQLEDCQRIGWQIVYVDHENDVLLVDYDPWE